MVWLNSDAIVDRSPDALFAPQVSLGRLHRNMAQQKLNLLQFASRRVAQPGTASPKIVWRQIVDADFLSVRQQTWKKT
jgi:hypothetical protein